MGSRGLEGKGSNQSAHNLMMDAPVITGSATDYREAVGLEAEPTHLMPPLSLHSLLTAHMKSTKK